MTGTFAPSARQAARAGAVVLGGLGTGALVVRVPGAVALLVPTTAVVLVLVALTRWLCAPAGDAAATRRVVTWTLGAFAFHLLAGLVIWASPTLTGYFGGDATTYNAGAIALVQHWTSAGPMPVLPVGKNGFFYLLAGLYWIFGTHPATGLAVDAGMAAATIPLLYDATRRLFGTAAARAVPPIATLLPGFLIWASQLLREAGVYFFTALCIACAARLKERTTVGAFAGVVAGATLLFAWRADVGLLVVGGVVVGLAFGRGRGEAGLVGGVGVAALLLALVLGGGLGYSAYHFVTHTSLGQLNAIRADSSQSAASGYLPGSDITTPAHAAAYLPLGALYFLFGPFPWQIHGGRQLFGVPDTLAWWFLLPSLWRGTRSAWRIRRGNLLVLALPAVALSAVLSLFIANFGTTVRERMQVIVVLVPLLAYGWSLRRRRRVAPAGDPVPVAAAQHGIDP